jgi:hypothetical protein
MTQRLVARLASASVLTALLLSLVAGPAAAGSSPLYRWVDDDVVAGDGPDSCDSAGYSSIQDAIDDSAAGDWVLVCPGTYTEELVIPTGVKVRAMPNFRAKIVAPAVGSTVLVSMPGDGARLRGFVMQIPAGASIPLVRPFSVCHGYAAAVLVTGNNAVVRDNRIIATGEQTLTGSCGYDYGIVVGGHGDSATARVTFNWVTDFKFGGILVEDTDSYAWVRRNTLRFFHESDCTIFTVSCSVNVRSNSLLNESFPRTFGIGVESSARADISYNWVGSGPNACVGVCLFTVDPPTQALEWGIALTALDGAETTDVHHNVVKRVVGGIVTQDGADGAVVQYNRVSYGHYGLQIGGDNDEWHHNEVWANAEGGSAAPGASGNNIHDNNFHDNTSWDCHDQSSGSGTAGTANTWQDNVGASDSPDGLCGPGGS